MRDGLLSVRERITNSRKATFLRALKGSGNVSMSAKLAGWTVPSANYHFRNDPKFKQKWEEAIEEATDSLEAEAVRRGRDGFDKVVTYQGKVTYHRYPDDWPDETKAGKYMKDPLTGDPIPVTIREYSDRMLELLLKANRDKFKDNIEIGVNHKGGVLLAMAPKLALPPPEDGAEPPKQLTWEQEAEQQQEQHRRRMAKAPVIDGQSKRL